MTDVPDHVLLKAMRDTLVLCAQQFRRYGDEHQRELETSTLTLVERSQLARNIERNHGIAGIIERLVASAPAPVSTAWKPVAIAPQDGKPLRLLGRRDDGSIYIETGRWANIVWSVQQQQGFQAPTHWCALEALPEDYDVPPPKP